jgi:hypothetical protein
MSYGVNDIQQSVSNSAAPAALLLWPECHGGMPAVRRMSDGCAVVFPRDNGSSIVLFVLAPNFQVALTCQLDCLFKPAVFNKHQQLSASTECSPFN